MPHVTVLGTKSAARSCGVTTAIDLLAARYLHTTSVDDRHVSRTLVGNTSGASPDSATGTGSRRTPLELPIRRRGSGWLAADLRVPGVDVDSGALEPSPGCDDGMAPWRATNRAARRARSIAGLASTDMGVAEVHDSVTPTELISYEDVGFAEPAAVSAVTILEGPVTDGR